LKPLIAFYSRTGTTKQIAEEIANALSADLDKIIDLKQRLGKLNFLRAARDAKGEKLTKIQVQRNPLDYDLIIVGTPIWWGSLTPAVRAYLSTYDLNGKKVAFFITSQGEDREHVFGQMQELVHECELVGTFGVLQKIVKTGEYSDQLTSFIDLLKQYYSTKGRA
jgi:flavodoxin